MDSAFKEKILLVDDEETILTVLQSVLNKYTTITARDGDEALLILKNTKDIFLVISDYKMPRMNGIELLSKSKEEFPEIPFYILTGFGDKELVVSLFEKGLDGFLDKPFKTEDLLALVDKVVKDRNSLIEEENEIFNIFLEDAQQNLEELDYKISTINDGPDGIKDIKRLLHTLKGSSSFIKNCDQISELSHKAEDMIKVFVEKNISLSSVAIEALLESIDFLRAMLVGLKKEKNKRFDLTEIVLKLSLQEIETKQPVVEAKQSFKVEEKKSEGIFVQSSKLDELMEQAGNLIVLRNLLNDLISSQGMSKNENSSKLKDIFQELDSISSNLHTEIGQMRKVPIISILKPYHRFIRELSAATGKKLSLQINDHEVFVDKDAGKYLSDSLIHLIRNSADHGIEEGETRIKAGKKEDGHISVSAFESIDGIRIVVEDDGRGIDSKKLIEKALGLGVVTESHLKNMSDKEKLELIFHSGVSTAKKLTKISGRGEGMDIVKDALSKVKGTIKVESSIGQWTRFIIDIPHAKSVTILNSLIVFTQGNYFAMPTDLVKKIIRLDGIHITKANSKKYIQDQDELLRLIYLEDLVDLSHFEGSNAFDANRSTHSIAIVFSKGIHKFGFVVDDVVQQLQIVYKRFDQYVQTLPAFKGTTFLKDGRPCLVLDLDWIVDHLTLSKEVQEADSI